MTLTVQVATQNMLRYVATAVGAGSDTTSLTQAALIAACAEGPLKAKLSSPVTNGSETSQIVAWTELQLDPELSVNVIPQSPSPAVIGYVFAHPASTNVLQLTSLAAGAAFVEIRFNPTLIR